jgi:hypothetical protein
MQFIAVLRSEHPPKLLMLWGRSMVGARRDIITSILPIMAVEEFIVGYLHSITVRLSKMQFKKLLMLC